MRSYHADRFLVDARHAAETSHLSLEAGQMTIADASKFSTQRFITYALLLIFATVVANVLVGQDQAERSTIIQTVINFMSLAVGYWLGTSKTSGDKDATAARILEAATPVRKEPEP